jgi:hypothetical protein
MRLVIRELVGRLQIKFEEATKRLKQHLTANLSRWDYLIRIIPEIRQVNTGIFEFDSQKHCLLFGGFIQD